LSENIFFFIHHIQLCRRENKTFFLRVFVGTVGETFFLAPWIYLSKKTFFFFIDHRKPDFFLRIFVGTVGTSRVILSPHSLNVDAKNKTKKNTRVYFCYCLKENPVSLGSNWLHLSLMEPKNHWKTGSMAPLAPKWCKIYIYPTYIIFRWWIIIFGFHLSSFT